MAGVTLSAVGKVVRLALLTGAVSHKIPGRSRIATCGRLFEGTDANCLGQTCVDGPATPPVSTFSGITSIAAVTLIWNYCASPEFGSDKCCQTVGSRRENC